MTIETQFNIGDTVYSKERKGLVTSLRIDVPQDMGSEAPPTAGTPVISYKVYFDGKFESHLENKLSSSPE